ncbi:MAG: response regulator [Thermoanaerobaculia bacterium]
MLSKNLLIVDDQASNVRLLECTLRRGGFTSVSTTTDPCAVNALHRDHHYDLILLDLVMPVMDGYEVMEGLAEIEGKADLPVLVMSADPNQKGAAMRAGARDFMDKPFVLAEVVARVLGLLDRKRTAAGH